MITSDVLQKAMFASIGEEEQTIIQRVSLAGQKILFGQKTHQHIFDSMNGKEGAGVSKIMLLLFDASKASMPRGTLLPAGAIILAKVLEFTEKAGIKTVDESVFNNELQEMITLIMDRFDKTFRDKIAKSTGKPIPEQPEQQPGQQAAQQPTGLINSGVA